MNKKEKRRPGGGGADLGLAADRQNQYDTDGQVATPVMRLVASNALLSASRRHRTSVEVRRTGNVFWLQRALPRAYGLLEACPSDKELGIGGFMVVEVHRNRDAWLWGRCDTERDATAFITGMIAAGADALPCLPTIYRDGRASCGWVVLA